MLGLLLNKGWCEITPCASGGGRGDALNDKGKNLFPFNLFLKQQIQVWVKLPNRRFPHSCPQEAGVLRHGLSNFEKYVERPHLRALSVTLL